MKIKKSCLFMKKLQPALNLKLPQLDSMKGVLKMPQATCRQLDSMKDVLKASQAMGFNLRHLASMDGSLLKNMKPQLDLVNSLLKPIQNLAPLISLLKAFPKHESLMESNPPAIKKGNRVYNRYIFIEKMGKIGPDSVH